MLPTIATGNVASATASTTYTVANSCRFDDGSSPSLTRTASGTNSSTQKWTFSFWIKRFSDGGSAHQRIFLHENDATHAQKFLITFKTDYKLHIETYDGTYEYNVKTDMLFRDFSAWYHIVVRVDTTQGTEADRYRIYVNGTQVDLTEVTHGYPTQNWNLSLDDKNHNIGLYHGGSGGTEYLDAGLAEFVYCDGQSLAPTSFGEFDSDSPTIWKPIDVSGLTFGNIGYYLDFEDSSAFGNDVSGNNNDFGTVTNLAATDQATDTPTNNFCVLNGVFGVTNQALAEGNLKVTNSTTTWNFRPATIGVTAGKWYAEYKITTTNYHLHGVCDLQYAVAQGVNSYTNVGFGTGGVGHYVDGESYVAGSNASYGDSYGDGDMLGIALDMDNNKVYFAKNGTWQNSGDPTSGATGTGAISLPTTGTYTFAESVRSGGSVEVNFGNPPYANSSDAADANGYGAFEYAPPSGYYALCTKNLAEFG